MKTVKVSRLFLVMIILLPTVVLSQTAHAAYPYRNYDPLIAAFKDLVTLHPQLMSYEVVGKSVLGRDILMFKIGNPNGGRILFDGALHGNEAAGSELLYSLAVWLLESNDSLANDILARTYTLMIPIVNADEENIVRKNANGVDLNRNFATDWPSRLGSPDPDNAAYQGPSPLSEPESQTLVAVFGEYNPRFYVNLHMWAAPYYAGCRYANRTLCRYLVERIGNLSSSRGVEPFRYSGEFSGDAMAIGDAAKLGITSFLIELAENMVSLEEVRTTLLQKIIPIASVLSQESGLTLIGDVNGDKRVDIYDALLMAGCFGSRPSSPNWNPNADVNGDGIVDIYDVITLQSHFT
jgi:Zinc carboxypeptidase/Dockerin type I domain